MSIALDLDDFKLIDEIKSTYHKKNISQALAQLLKFYRILADEQHFKQKSIIKPSGKLLNPQVVA